MTAGTVYQAAKKEPNLMTIGLSAYDFWHPGEDNEGRKDLMDLLMLSSLKSTYKLSVLKGVAFLGTLTSSKTDAIAGTLFIGGSYALSRFQEYRRKRKEEKKNA
jgi:hypothetical protein